MKKTGSQIGRVVGATTELGREPQRGGALRAAGGVVLLVLAALAAWSCKSGGCANDGDCKDARVCVDGACVDEKTAGSSGTTASGPSSSASGGASCDNKGECTACGTCAVAADCVNEVNACNASADCSALATCIQACASGDDICEGGCYSQYPGGQDTYINVEVCLQCACSTSCGTCK